MLSIQLHKGYKQNKYLQEMINLEKKLFETTLKPIYKIDQEIYYIYILNYDQVIGFATYKDRDLSFDLFKIGVDPIFQNQGIGSMIIKEMKEKKITIEVRDNNIKAIKFYEKHGFKKITILKNYYGSNDGIKMIRE